MSVMQVKINSLNQIIAIIDSKAATYKDDRHHMPGARAFAEKKLILDIIKEAENLALTIIPKPAGLLEDLGRLRKTL